MTTTTKFFLLQALTVTLASAVGYLLGSYLRCKFFIDFFAVG